MLPKFQSVVDQVEEILKSASCEKYSYIDRVGLLRYRHTRGDQPLPPLVSQALETHGKAVRLPCTLLENPVFVFCPDNLNDTSIYHNVDIVVSLRFKLGKYIDTYEDLVRWYLSVR